MFESDDFDQVLSQFEFPDVDNTVQQTTEQVPVNNTVQKINSQEENNAIQTETEQDYVQKPEQVLENKKYDQIENISNSNTKENTYKPECFISENENTSKKDCFISPKHMKRKIITSHFNHQSKRKFPGPAGLLNGVLEETKDSIGQIELLSQDINFTQNNLRQDIFESPLWKRLLTDTKEWQIKELNSIKTIKDQALSGNLRRRKAQNVAAFIEAIDRSVTDPLIILRDETGSIKCTLHRDAWSKFSSYIVSEYCALILQKPTVLTTGSAFKKHYLNITLSNLLAIYTDVVLEDKNVPDGYKIVYEDDFTVIKADIGSEGNTFELSNGDEDMFDGLDSFFSDETF